MRHPLAALAAALLLAPLALGTVPAHARATTVGTTRQAAFAAAAAEFHVPEAVLLAVSYQETQWEAHAGLQSTSGGYGPMHLTDVTPAERQEPDARTGGLRAVPDAPGLHTLAEAARLAGVPAAALKASDSANIRGGAALLAHDAGTPRPSTVGGWYRAVATYASPDNPSSGREFADSVFATIATGAARITDDNQRVTLPATPNVRPDSASVPAPATPAGTPTPECPADLKCDYVPAYYGEDGGPGNTDKTDYCNYDVADRPHDVKIQYVVMHDTEEFYDATVNLTQRNNYCASFSYLIRSSDGFVTQTVPNSVVAWHAGNYWVNMHSIGIEEEGFLILGPTWYSEPLYRSAAKLLRYLHQRYGIPLDRGHILGHDTVPGTRDGSVAGMHQDPGVAYDWNHVLSMAGAPIVPTGLPWSDVVTIRPDYKSNKVVVSGCQPVQFGGPSSCTAANAVDFPAMSSSDVFLRTAPSADAPLVKDPYLSAALAGTNRAENWGSRASTGQQFVVADRKGDWKAIWYGGQEAWFLDPPGRRTTVPSTAWVVTPKAGKASVSLYGEALPTSAEVPDDPNVQQYVGSRQVAPYTKYTMLAGQRYVLVGPAITDLYFAWNIDASVPYDRTDFHGATKYYWIFYNHRMALVRADDVDVSIAL